MNESQLHAIWKKTKGHCHFCGDKITMSKHGWNAKDSGGYWEVDHVIQRQKGGASSIENCLPACTRCNRLRWNRKGKQLRELLLLGLIARAEIRKNRELGKRLKYLRHERLNKNQQRRQPS